MGLAISQISQGQVSMVMQYRHLPSIVEEGDEGRKECQIWVGHRFENASRHSIDCILVYIMSDGNERLYGQNRGRIGGSGYLIGYLTIVTQ